MKVSFKAALAGALLFFLGSCSSIPRNLIEPKVHLQNVKVQDPTFSDATMVFNFQVENPNSVPLEVDALNYKIHLNGTPFTEGSMTEGLKVGPQTSALIQLPIQVKYSDLIQSLTGFLSQGMTPYQVEGSVRMGFFSIPFKKEGEVRLQQE